MSLSPGSAKLWQTRFAQLGDVSIPGGVLAFGAGKLQEVSDGSSGQAPRGNRRCRASIGLTAPACTMSKAATADFIVAEQDFESKLKLEASSCSAPQTIQSWQPSETNGSTAAHAAHSSKRREQNTLGIKPGAVSQQIWNAWMLSAKTPEKCSQKGLGNEKT